MAGKTCCITGHRTIPKDKINNVKDEIQKEVLQAVEDGYTHFISGFAQGVDLMFAAIVAELKKENRSLTLEAAIPYKGRLKSKDQTFQDLFVVCNDVTVLCDRYIPQCFFLRNRYMVDKSSRIIAVYDGREKGGTFYTIQYAQKEDKEIQEICLYSDS